MREAIILAGGLGTRLQHLVPDLPKALAPINGRPFLEYMLEYLIAQKVEHFIFAVSHKKEELKKYLSINYPQLKISYAEEETPLGTGGAILNAIDLVKSNAFFVFNADTYFPIDINSLELFAIEHHFQICIASKHMVKPYRYGTIQFNSDNRITGFCEKATIEEGYINGGIYYIRKEIFDSYSKNKAFSFEKDLLEIKLNTLNIGTIIFNDFFIDIGVEHDYFEAQNLFKKFEKSTKRALFLDRDGVINKLLVNDYVKNWDEFTFCDDVKSDLAQICSYFDYVFVITNQQCIEKGIITSDELDQIHEQMRLGLESFGVNITKIYYCPHLASKLCDCRKPNAGMLIEAKKDFPDLSFEQSYFIGDSDSDIAAAKKVGCISVGKRHEFNLQAFKDISPDFSIVNFNELNAVLTR